MSDLEYEAVAGEVWQEADNVLLLCIKPGVMWRDFRGSDVPWDAPLIAHPLRRLLHANGELDVNTQSFPQIKREQAALIWDEAIRSVVDWLRSGDPLPAVPRNPYREEEE